MEFIKRQKIKKGNHLTIEECRRIQLKFKSNNMQKYICFKNIAKNMYVSKTGIFILAVGHVNV